MKLNTRHIALATIALGLFSGLAAHADQTNEETKIAFSAPVQIPGMVLNAGTYTFKLVDPEDHMGTVQILNASETKVYATVDAIPTERENPTAHTQITLDDIGVGSVPVVTRWFYPGRETGYQFSYSSSLERELKQGKEQTLIGPAASADFGE